MERATASGTASNATNSQGDWKLIAAALSHDVPGRPFQTDARAKPVRPEGDTASGVSSNPRADRVHLDDRLNRRDFDVGGHDDRDPAASDALGAGDALDEARARRVAHEEPEGVRGGHEALTCETTLDGGASTRGDLVLRHAPDRGPARLERRRDPAAPAAGHAADVRAERRRASGASDVARVEDHRACSGDARGDRRADDAEEPDVDGAVAQLGVETRRHVPARAHQLPLDARPRDAVPGRDHDPRAVNGDALLEAAALVGREGGRGGDREGRGREGGDDEKALHGTLRNQNTDIRPPTSSNAADPPAKTSVTSRDLSRCPRREPRSSYTCFRSSSSVAVKNSPPDSCATSRSTSGSGGTWIRVRSPPGSSSSTTPFGVPTSTV